MPTTGDRVRIHYTGRMEDGTTFDSTRDREPLEFTVGTQEILPGIDRTVLGMQVGETATVTVPPEDGYGLPQPGLAVTVDRSQLPEDVREGIPLRATVDGQDMVLWVAELTETTAVVDPNHPLAGETLVFDVELLAVGV
ncbi:MAG: peptidylprolyl isomerase [Acidimicrobiia bacterium]|nr:peptidylprolyl isomerase [Acidimicrobiia bacterium]